MMNVCIVGCGAIGPVHALAIEKTESAKLYAVCDLNKERADALANKRGVKVFYDFDEMLHDDNIDSVHICTPHYLHVPMAKKALENGKYVILEKPAAINFDELNELAEYDKKYPHKLGFVLQNRRNERVRVLKDCIEKDEDKGGFVGAKAFHMWSRTPKYYAQDEWRGKWSTEGGGALINQAVHTLDLLDWLCGGILAVRASISTKLLDECIEVEDTVDVLIDLKNGSRACFYAVNTYTQNSPVNLEINYENVTYRYADEYLYRIRKDCVPEIIAGEKIDVGWKSYWGAGHADVINSFYNVMCGKEGEYISLSDGISSAKAVLAIYESAKNDGKKVYIK